ncbi:MAG: gamma-glutamylcyclotransferase [Burkholderiaceae bacterium]
MSHSHLIVRDPTELLEHTLKTWRTGTPERGLWVFGYASLIWRPDFEFTQRCAARVQGWHRALHMWSRVNRGTPECPGLVFALLTGGSCQGMVFHVAAAQVEATLQTLWEREMPTGVYDPRWLNCKTAQGDVSALSFTLPRSSPNYCGVLTDAQYARIFKESCGRYGTTLDYAQQTYEGLLREGIHDRALEKLLRNRLGKSQQIRP